MNAAKWKFDLNGITGRDVVVAAGLLVVTLLLFRDITTLWWTYDDPYLLHYAIVHHPEDYLLKPEVWQAMPQRLFTPLLPVSFDADIVLFGVDARASYIRHLCELGLFAVLLYATLRLRVSVSVSLTGALLAILGAPFTAWATQLMLRHYLESAIAALASAALFLIGMRRSRVWHWLSAAAYFIAICLKEISVPLPLVLALLPEQRWHERWRALWPHGVALGVYTLWRRYMLGEFFGGYGWAVSWDETPQLLAALPMKIARTFASASPLAGVALLIVLLLLAAANFRSGRGAGSRALVIGCAMAAAVLPIAPVSTQMELRFTVVSWLALSVIAVAGATSLPPRIRHTLLAVALVLAVVNHRAQWSKTFASAKRMSDEARFFVSLGAGDLLRNPAIPPAAMTELAWLASAAYGRPGGAAWTYDDLYFCSARPINRIFEYQRSSIVNVTRAALGQAALLCRTYDVKAPLRASFRYSGETLRWRLGPYHDGAYSFVFADGVQAFEVPATGAFKLRGVPSLELRVRYRAPNGFVTYSPSIAVPLKEELPVQWQR